MESLPGLLNAWEEIYRIHKNDIDKRRNEVKGFFMLKVLLYLKCDFNMEVGFFIL